MASKYYDRKGRSVEAMVWRGKQDNEPLAAFAGHWANVSTRVPYVTTRAGAMALFGGDWVVKMAEGRFEVMADEYFRKEYSETRTIPIYDVACNLINALRRHSSALAYVICRSGAKIVTRPPYELPADLIVDAEEHVTVLSLINTLLVRLGEPRVIVEVPTDMDGKPMDAVSAVYAEADDGEA